MRIIVPIKQVPETSAVKMNPETGTMVREGVEAIVNPLDLYAIETALRLRERFGGEVIALSMGPAKAASALREAVAMGCDSARLITGREFAGSDTWATGYALAAAIRRVGDFDLVICGERATDGDTGQVGPAIAAFLDLPVATYAAHVDLHQPGLLTARRLVEQGYEELLIQLPAVLTVVKEIAVPRLPTLSGKRKARALDIPAWGAGELGVEPGRVGLAGSPTRVIKVFKPKVARECEKIVAKDESAARQAADRLVEFLRAKELL